MLTKALISPFSLNDVIDIQNYGKNSAKVICPACKSPLVAKQGKIKQWHFAHANNEDCEFSYETQLHLIAKNCIKSGDIFYLPELRDSSKQILKPRTKILIDEVIIEHQLSNIKPDLIIVSKGHRLLVEIAVTHFVDPAKRRKIEALGISCLQIDLSDCRTDSEIYFTEKIRNLVLKGQYKKQWIFHRFSEKLKQQKQQEELTVRKNLERSISNELIQYLAEYKYLIELKLDNIVLKKGIYYTDFEGVFSIYGHKVFYLSFTYYNSLADFQGGWLEASYDKDYWVDIDIMSQKFQYLRLKLVDIIKKALMRNSS